jgi:hypothetical protein
MSRMSDLSLDIQAMLEDDVAPRDIARILEIPVSWVYAELGDEELSPFETINS